MPCFLRDLLEGMDLCSKRLPVEKCCPRWWWKNPFVRVTCCKCLFCDRCNRADHAIFSAACGYARAHAFGISCEDTKLKDVMSQRHRGAATNGIATQRVERRTCD
eukprot:6486794-Amphidinium_carterae.1